MSTCIAKGPQGGCGTLVKLAFWETSVYYVRYPYFLTCRWESSFGWHLLRKLHHHLFWYDVCFFSHPLFFRGEVSGVRSYHVYGQLLSFGVSSISATLTD